MLPYMSEFVGGKAVKTGVGTQTKATVRQEGPADRAGW